MIVSKRRYDRLERTLMVEQRENSRLRGRVNELVEEYNGLVDLLNAKGGQEFLDHATIGGSQFTGDEIRSLLSLCHPDKHGGREVAVRMTQRLIELRKEAKR